MIETSNIHRKPTAKTVGFLINGVDSYAYLRRTVNLVDQLLLYFAGPGDLPGISLRYINAFMKSIKNKL